MSLVMEKHVIIIFRRFGTIYWEMLLAISFIVWAIPGGNAVFSYPDEPRKASIGEFPWMALLMNRETYRAGATIISRYYVVTVCKRPSMFRDLPEPEYLYSNYRVVGGTNSIDPLEYQGTQLRWIYYWEDHPKCRVGGDSGYWTFDISIIKVTQQFIFNELLKPMPFLTDQSEMQKRVRDVILGHIPCSFAGWGAYKFININTTYFEDWGLVIYTPSQPEVPYCPVLNNDTYCRDNPKDRVYCKDCFPKELRVIELSVMDDDHFECENSTFNSPEFSWNRIYRRDPPVDALCVIGTGVQGTAIEMKRSGMPCSRDPGNSLFCQHPDGPVVVGHFSYSTNCDILWSNYPTVFTRYDWEIHSWLKQYYSPSMFSKHWVDPVYPVSKEYCPKQPYAGPIPPNW